MLRKLHAYYANDLPLRYKFLAANLFILIALSGSAFFIFYRGYRVVTDNTIAAESALVSQTENTIAARVRTMETVSGTISSLAFLTRAVYADDLDAWLADERTDTWAQDFFNTAGSFLESDAVSSIRIYLNGDYKELLDKYGGSSGGILQPLNSVRSSYWHGIFMGVPGLSSLLCPDFYLTNAEKKDCGRLAFISRFPDAGTAGSPEPAAFTAVYFSRDELDDLLRVNQHDSGSVYYLVNSRGNLAATSDATLSGLYYLDYDRIPAAIPSEEGFSRTTVLGNDLYMAYREIEGTDWRLVCVIPVKNVTSSEQALFRTLIIIFLFLSALLIILELYLTNSITSRVSRVTARMLLRDRNTPARIPPSYSGKDEVGQLIAVYNSTMDQLSELMEAQTESAEKLKLSEVKALQAQINPHFLYNMLDMINWLSISGNQEAVSEAVRSLSRFYKLTLSGRKITVSIAEELKHAELYVSLQNMRFDHGIDLLVDVPDEIMECGIPKLILQPIVENAVLHGICEKESRQGTIVIMAWFEESRLGEEDIVITVSDDGVGMPEEILENLLKEDRTEDSAVQNGPSGPASGSNIAIYNTHQRLRLIYGGQYGLKFSSVPQQGTEVEIRIPKTPAL